MHWQHKVTINERKAPRKRCFSFYLNLFSLYCKAICIAYWYLMPIGSAAFSLKFHRSYGVHIVDHLQEIWFAHHWPGRRRQLWRWPDLCHYEWEKHSASGGICGGCLGPEALRWGRLQHGDSCRGGKISRRRRLRQNTEIIQILIRVPMELSPLGALFQNMLYTRGNHYMLKQL